MARYASWFGWLDGKQKVCVVNESTGRIGDETDIPLYKVRKRVHVGYSERAYNLYDYAEPIWIRASRVKKRKATPCSP